MLRLTTYLTLIWAIMLPFTWPEDPTFFYYRFQLIMLSGIISLGYMTAAMLLAIRPVWLESKLNGLDKMYHLHKQLGIGTIIALSLHWFICNSPKWLVQSGIIQRPERPARIIEGIDWHALAKIAGEWSFYLFLLFAAISLIQAITYKKFVIVHKLAGIIFIAGAIHSILLLKFNSDFIIYNIAAIIMASIGCYCSWLSLTGRIGKTRKVKGLISHTERFTDHTVNFQITLESPIDYQAGQFVYLNFYDGESSHPFTVVHYDRNNQTIEIAVKALGDYTTEMFNNLQEEQQVEVEGSYGQFLLSNTKKQVWIGAGIGITPFVAWLESIIASQRNEIEKVVFFYCAKNKLDAFFAQRLQHLTNAISNVELKILFADEGQFLTPQEITRLMGNNIDYSVSFCGPEIFAKNLKEGLAKTGWPVEKFHHEMFSMR